jgi:hypothetical protein
VSRRALIVTDVALGCMFVVAGVTNLVLREPVGIVAGISAMAIGAACAVTACLFIAAGGWTEGRAEAPRSRGAPGSAAGLSGNRTLSGSTNA